MYCQLDSIFLNKGLLINMHTKMISILKFKVKFFLHRILFFALYSKKSERNYESIQ